MGGLGFGSVPVPIPTRRNDGDDPFPIARPPKRQEERCEKEHGLKFFNGNSYTYTDTHIHKSAYIIPPFLERAFALIQTNDPTLGVVLI